MSEDEVAVLKRRVASLERQRRKMLAPFLLGIVIFMAFFAFSSFLFWQINVETASTWVIIVRSYFLGGLVTFLGFLSLLKIIDWGYPDDEVKSS